ncbi:hypothetical protein KMP13_05845 [Epibacterium ulvae]|uniref:DUF4286 family protein n=1 Tax=Epibacterium ulvae TaxID=1156985 RepID=UPI001BFBFD3F|nr:DUF4286 family protein [Epibacterium ulvae]MBT8153423.1 hypothetical protein [Epibacterium ulvae]
MESYKTQNAQLFVWTDIDPAHEGDFNLWYDREHMEERVAIEGFCWARRYRNRSDPGRRYLAIYRTENIQTFGTEAYAQAFNHQTDWSNTNFARMTNTKRRVMHVPTEGGFGSGAQAVLLTLADAITDLDAIASTLTSVEGVLGFHVMVPDETLSTPLPSEDLENRTLEPAILVDATNATAAQAAGAALLNKLNLGSDRASYFDFMWELRSQDLENSAANRTA